MTTEHADAPEVLTANLAGRVRREIGPDGRRYLVAPMTLIVPGVLNGSMGPLYYPEEEVARRPEMWNGIPIVLYHPKSGDRYVSARDPEVLNTSGLGYLYRTKYEPAGQGRPGRLRTEGWFDEDRTRRVDPRVLYNLEREQPIGLSTGLFTRNDPAPSGSVFNGRAYTHVAREYIPDHLAILPDIPGACSIKDGCGVLVNSLTGGLGVDDDLLDLLELPADATLDQVLNRLNEEAEAFLVENKGKLPSGKLDMTPEKACQILKDGTAHGRPLTKRQRGMFGALCGKRPQPTKNSSADPTPTQGDRAMPLTPDQKNAIVHNLAANCGCQGNLPWKGKTPDQLAALSDDTLIAYRDAQAAIKGGQINNGAPDGFVDALGNRHVYNQSTKQWEMTPASSPPQQHAPTGNQGHQQGGQKQGQPLTSEQWLSMMPPEFRPVWNAVAEAEKNTRTELCERIIANSAVTDDLQRNNLREYLLQKPTTELRMMLSIIPQQPQANGGFPTVPQQPAAPTIVNWMGAAGGAPPMILAPSSEVPLSGPTYDFKRAAPAGAA